MGQSSTRNIWSDSPTRISRIGFLPFLSNREGATTPVEMEKKTKGAWLLAQSKSLDGFSGAGAARLENISYSGKVGRLYNLLRRQSDEASTFTISKQIVENACRLNGILKSDRQVGLQLL